jgi:hypothetical protein
LRIACLQKVLCPKFAQAMSRESSLTGLGY